MATSAAPLAIDLVDVVALDGGFPVLAGVTLAVPRGAVVAVLGGNGAGKTSLLRTVAGLTTVASGSGQVLGEALGTLARSLVGRVGLLGHATGCYDDLTARDNLGFTAEIVRAAPARVEAVLATTGIAGRLATTPLAGLSAGQRRRVALAQLLLRAPELTLLDEPYSSLDGDGRGLVDRVVDDCAGAGSTVVLTSHDHDRARDAADLVCTMAGGLVVSLEPGGRGGRGAP